MDLGKMQELAAEARRPGFPSDGLLQGLKPRKIRVAAGCFAPTEGGPPLTKGRGFQLQAEGAFADPKVAARERGENRVYCRIPDEGIPVTTRDRLWSLFPDGDS